jgi:saxitoxin biosynthesis operon SxtJ-like protein
MIAKPRFRREREFGLLVGGILVLLGGWPLWRGRGGTASEILLALGTVLVLAGLLAPSILRGPYRGWMALAEVLSVVMTTVILTLVYYGVVTPLGLLRKAIGGDPLRRRASSAGSYWHPYSARQSDPRHYEKMF